MRIMSWNVNGLRAVVKKPDFEELFEKYNPDVLCVQETKAQEADLSTEHHGSDDYFVEFHSAKKRGYSGVAIYSKIKPLSIQEGIGIEKFDDEGRVLTFEFEKFYVVSCYVPNAQPELVRINYREEFNDELLKFLQKLRKKKGVILCGDLNVAHNEIDLKNPKANKNNPGFSDQERSKFNELLDAGYVDTWRHFHPEEIKYSWWSYRFSARTKNIGWRIDYFVVNKEFLPQIKSAEIHNDIMGSDHCPVSIVLK